MQQHVWQPFFEPSFSSRAKRVHHVRPVYSVITAALVLTCGYSATCGVQYMDLRFRHRNQVQLPPATASVSPHSAVSLPFQPIGHSVAVSPFARYPRVGFFPLLVLLGHQGESTMHARRRLTLAQCATGLSTATPLV